MICVLAWCIITNVRDVTPGVQVLPRDPLGRGPLSRLNNSQIRNHSEETNHPASHDNFSILNSARNATSHIIYNLCY